MQPSRSANSHAIRDTEREILDGLPEMSNREVLVGLQQTAQYAMHNAEIAANLALNTESAYVTISSADRMN